ncbi:MAG: hypothetical protein JEZ11_20955 [Desulfobacterales bacterium]|nr:hypothetical protein [Desulfobacterales bacterium]
MNDYWNAVSGKHQDKIRDLAKSHGITIDRAFGNIVRHLEWEMGQVAVNGHFQRYVTAQRIEGMIDLITE